MIIHRDIIQGTPEWHEIRVGKMSASHADAIGNCGKGLETYVKQIVRGMFIEPKHITNKDIERGNELEPLARLAYEFEHGVQVEEVGFVTHNDFVGCSPDGLVGSDGLTEYKARNDEIHFNLLIDGKVDSKTIWQMNMQMLICNRKWCDFVSYNPNFKKSFFEKRFYPDMKKFQALTIGFGIGEQKIKELLSNEAIMFELGKRA